MIPTTETPPTRAEYFAKVAAMMADANRAMNNALRYDAAGDVVTSDAWLRLAAMREREAKTLRIPIGHGLVVYYK
jgi:hypothetical protein